MDLGGDKETFEPFLSETEEVPSYFGLIGFESVSLTKLCPNYPRCQECEDLPPRPTFDELKTPSPDEPTTDESPEFTRPDYTANPLVHRYNFSSNSVIFLDCQPTLMLQNNDFIISPCDLQSRQPADAKQ